MLHDPACIQSSDTVSARNQLDRYPTLHSWNTLCRLHRTLPGQRRGRRETALTSIPHGPETDPDLRMKFGRAQDETVYILTLFLASRMIMQTSSLFGHSRPQLHAWFGGKHQCPDSNSDKTSDIKPRQPNPESRLFHAYIEEPS